MECEVHFLGGDTETQWRERPAPRLPIEQDPPPLLYTLQGCSPHVLPLSHQSLPSRDSYPDTWNAGVEGNSLYSL